MNSIVKRYNTVLSIAGSDGSGGAGIQADIKTISACGGYAMTAITAITIQNTVGVRGVHIVPTDIVAGQISAIAEDIHIDAMKLGMLPTAEIVHTVAELLRRYRIRNIVLDPVMVATSGDKLIDDDAMRAVREEIFPIAALVTPNIPETECITGIKIHGAADFPRASERILAMGARCVLIKGGHLAGDELSDHLYEEQAGKLASYSYTYERIDTLNTHGTGCTLSSAIATYLALGNTLPEAIQLAEDYVHKAILCGAEYTTGRGHGPVHHLFKFWE